MFGFKTRSQVLCESCGHQSNTYTQNCSLTLQIPNSKGNLTMGDCMDKFVAADRLFGDNKYECSGCNKKVNALKTTAIETCPRILIVDFVRYSFGKKNNAIIQYPKSLKLDGFMSSQIDKKNALRL